MTCLLYDTVLYLMRMKHHEAVVNFMGRDYSVVKESTLIGNKQRLKPDLLCSGSYGNHNIDVHIIRDNPSIIDWNRIERFMDSSMATGRALTSAKHKPQCSPTYDNLEGGVMPMFIPGHGYVGYFQQNEIHYHRSFTWTTDSSWFRLLHSLLVMF